MMLISPDHSDGSEIPSKVVSADRAFKGLKEFDGNPETEFVAFLIDISKTPIRENHLRELPRLGYEAMILPFQESVIRISSGSKHGENKYDRDWLRLINLEPVFDCHSHKSKSISGPSFGDLELASAKGEHILVVSDGIQIFGRSEVDPLGISDPKTTGTFYLAARFIESQGFTFYPRNLKSGPKFSLFSLASDKVQLSLQQQFVERSKMIKFRASWGSTGIKTVLEKINKVR